MEMTFWGPEELTLVTEQAFGLVDITEPARAAARRSGLEAGSVQLFCPHTSCGLAVTELEDGLHADIEAFLEALAPVGGSYRHDDLEHRWQNLEPDERRNGWSHLRALVATAPSMVLPVRDGGLALGRWQRLFLVELDGPRTRRVDIQAWGRLRTPPAGTAG